MVSEVSGHTGNHAVFVTCFAKQLLLSTCQTDVSFASGCRAVSIATAALCLLELPAYSKGEGQSQSSSEVDECTKAVCCRVLACTTSPCLFYMLLSYAV